MRDGLTFYRSFHEALQEEPDAKKRLAGYEAIINYALYGIEPEGLKGTAMATYKVAKPVIDASNANSDNGKRGGAPKGNQNAKKQLKQGGLFLENKRGCETKTSNENENENDNDNLSVEPTEQEIKNYCKDNNLNKVNPIDFYKYYESKRWMVNGEHIKDWRKLVEAVNRNSRAKPKSNAGFMQRDYDFEELEKEILNR